MPQPLGQAQALDRIFTEHQCMLKVKTLGIRAIQALIQTGTGQVIGGAGVAQFQHALGIHQGGQVVVVGQVQLAQIARQPLQDRAWFGGVQVVGLQFEIGPVLASQQVAAIVGVQPAAATGIERKKYDEQQVYMAKNIVDRPGLLRSLENADGSGRRMFGSHHQAGWLSSKTLDRWLGHQKTR